MSRLSTIAGMAAAAMTVTAMPLSAKGIAPLTAMCGLSMTKDAATCPTSHGHGGASGDAVLRVDRTRLTASSVRADGRRQLDQLIASLN